MATLEPPFRLRVLSINIWCVPIVGKNTEQRVDLLLQRLAADGCPYDVIGFQEVFIPYAQRQFRAKLPALGLPYLTFFNSGSSLPTQAKGSGCVIASRYPILDTAWHAYSACGTPLDVTQWDHEAGKGVGLARIAIPAASASSAPHTVDVYLSHLVAQYHHKDQYALQRVLQAVECGNFIRCTRRSDLTLLLIDLNQGPASLVYRTLATLAGFKDAYSATHSPEDEMLHGSTLTAYRAETERLRELGSLPADLPHEVRDGLQTAARSITDPTFARADNYAYKPNAPAYDRDVRLDYILFGTGAHNGLLSAAPAGVPVRTWHVAHSELRLTERVQCKNGQMINYSDHCAVYAELGCVTVYPEAVATSAETAPALGSGSASAPTSGEDAEPAAPTSATPPHTPNGELTPARRPTLHIRRRSTGDVEMLETSTGSAGAARGRYRARLNSGGTSEPDTHMLQILTSQTASPAPEPADGGEEEGDEVEQGSPASTGLTGRFHSHFEEQVRRAHPSTTTAALGRASTVSLPETGFGLRRSLTDGNMMSVMSTTSRVHRAQAALIRALADAGLPLDRVAGVESDLPQQLVPRAYLQARTEEDDGDSGRISRAISHSSSRSTDSTSSEEGAATTTLLRHEHVHAAKASVAAAVAASGNGRNRSSGPPSLPPVLAAARCVSDASASGSEAAHTCGVAHRLHQPHLVDYTFAWAWRPVVKEALAACEAGWRESERTRQIQQRRGALGTVLALTIMMLAMMLRPAAPDCSGSDTGAWCELQSRALSQPGLLGLLAAALWLAGLCLGFTAVLRIKNTPLALISLVVGVVGCGVLALCLMVFGGVIASAVTVACGLFAYSLLQLGLAAFATPNDLGAYQRACDQLRILRKRSRAVVA